MNDPLRRGLRTLIQLVAGGGLTELLNALVVEMDPTVKLGVAIVATFLVTWAQNLLEDAGTIPSVWKAQASSGADPLTVDPAG